MAVFLAVLMLGLPSFDLGNQQMSVSPADNATAAAGDRVLTIGWPEFTTSIYTLNPLMTRTDALTYASRPEMMTIWPCYSFLFTRDVNAEMIGDLVTSYTISPDSKTWNFKLVNTAKFYDKNDPGANHPLTGADVMYTFWLIQNTSGSLLQFYFPVVNGNPIIQNMWTATGDPYDLYIQLSSAYAPFLSALTIIPILPEYVWSTQVWNWANFRTGNPVIAPIIGSGPFYYMLDGMPDTGVVELGRSPTWFATEAKGWQLHVNKLVIKTELGTDPHPMIYDYENGLIDIMEFVSPEHFNSSLPGVRFAQSSGFVYEYNLNQLTDALRASYPALKQGTNNQLLLDPVVKKAMAMMVDKTAFVQDVLNGLGTVADSLCPDVNPWHYSYPNPVEFNTAQARQDLWNAGWRYDTMGNPIGATSTVYPVCKVGGTDPLRFRFWTVDVSPEYDIGARKIATWAAQGGIDLWYDYNPQTLGFMNVRWYTADYDTWLWDWWFSSTSEVSTDIMKLLTTEAIGSWSDVFYSNQTYDDLYYASLREVDPVARRVITDQMQAMAYEDFGCQAVAYRKELYAASDLGPDHWALGSYGNWEQHYTLIPDQLCPWLYMQIYPADNTPPVITYLPDSYEVELGTTTVFDSAATDSSPLEFRWNFGDGTKTNWSSDPSATHIYDNEGRYDAYFMVREKNSADQFVTWAKTRVRVFSGNSVPHDLGFTYAPSDPNTGDVVQFSGMATDDENDALTYTWNFGDGWTASGQNATHKFSTGAASYTVTMYVDDGHLGTDPRPATYCDDIGVILNNPPQIIVPDEPHVPWWEPYVFHVTASDSDTRDTLKFTWDWGDGEVSVTTTPTCSHTYKIRQNYVLTVWADDGTGITNPPHNVSDTGRVHVYPIPNHAPTLLNFTVSNVNPWNGQPVTFWATPIDLDGDILGVTFDFGDGNSSGIIYQSAPNTTVSATYTYLNAGDWFPSVTYTDTVTAPKVGFSTDFSWYVTVRGSHFILDLVQGWNLVSLPLIGYGYKASTLPLNPGDSVVRWNEHGYQILIIGIPMTDFAIAPSTGYWINVPTGTRTLTLYGYIPNTTQSRDITVPAGGGWALIGFAGLNTSRHASDIPAMFNPGAITTVAKYNPVTRTYSSWLSVIPVVNDFVLVPGEGYWALCSASGTLSYSP
ncbi:MAG: PKD domain-containing protein [Thermoplasmatota archaeon]